MNISPEFVGSLLESLLRASWQATLLAGVVLLLQRLLRRWLTPAWRHALWLIVVARLMLPFAPASAWSLFNLTPALPLLPASYTAKPSSASLPISPGAPPAAAHVPTSRSLLASDPHPTPAVARHSTLTTPSALDPSTIEALAVDPLAIGDAALMTTPGVNPDSAVWPWPALAIWALGVLVLSARLLRSWLRCRRELQSARPLDAAKWGHLLVECRERLRVRRSLRAFEVGWVHSPALCGWGRPRLLLPAGLAERLSPDELRHVLLHELAHLKRHDILVNWIATAAQALHWFNPVAWLAMRRLRAERELAADRLALVALGEDGAQSYGETILRLMAGLARPAVVPAMVGILEDRRALRERIQAIASFRRPGRWSWLAALLVGGLAIAGLTDATEGEGAVPPASPEEQTPAQRTNATADASRSRDDFLWGTLTVNSQPLPNMKVRLHYRHKREGDDGATDERGVLRIPRGLVENLSAISCKETGYVEVNPDTLANGFHYELNPVGRVEGRLHWGGAAAVGTRVGLIPVGLGAQRARAHSELLNTRTDDRGQFVFATVPPGRWQIIRLIDLPENPAWAATQRKYGPTAISSCIGSRESMVEVQANRTNQVELGRETRTLIGRVVAEGPHPSLDWSTFRFGLSLPWFPDTNTPAGRELARLIEVESQQTGGRLPNYHPEFEPDGRFTVHGVTPGDYELLVIFRGAPAAGPAVELQTVATVGGVVKVPPPDVNAPTRPFDLGAFQLRSVRPLRVGDSGTSFGGLTTTGESIQFSPGGGTPALLCFWEGGNQYELLALKRVIEAAGASGSLRALVLVSERNVAEAKRHWSYANTGWPLVQLADEPAVREAYEVETAPAMILLDADGKVVTRHWEVEALKPFIATIAGDKASQRTSPPEGQPLWGTVFLNGRPLESAYVSYYDHIRRLGGAGRTDARGRIFVYRNPTATRLVVWHDPFQAVLDATVLTNEFRVELGSARASVSGTLWRGDQLWPGKELTLQRRWPGLIEPGSHSANRTNQAFHIPATTDAQGRFEFREVPCGVWVVRSRDIEWSEAAVRPGEAATYELGRLGAAIVGQVVTDDPGWTPDWRNAHANLITNVRGLQRWLPGEVEADGSFVVPDVPAGDHELIIVVESARVISRNQLPVELGASPRTPVSVPEATATAPREIRVGTLQVQKRLPALSVVPSTEASKAKESEDRITITIEARPPRLYLHNQPVTFEQLQTELAGLAKTDLDLPVVFRVQTNTPVGSFVKVMDAVKAAGFTKSVSIFSIRPGETGAP